MRLITDMREYDRITYRPSSPKSGSRLVEQVQLPGADGPDIGFPNMNPCNVERDHTVAFFSINLNRSRFGLLVGGPRSGDPVNLGY